MKSSLFPIAFAFILSALPVLTAAESKSAPSAQAPNSSLAGEYTGSWKAQNDASGSLRIVLKQDGAAGWTAEASFTFEGAEVPTKVKSVKVEGEKIELVFGWEVQGTAAQSTLNGEVKGAVLSGKYDSTSAEGAAAGTWTVTRS